MQADYKLKRKFLLEKVVDSKVVREKRIKILADAKRLDAQAQELIEEAKALQTCEDQLNNDIKMLVEQDTTLSLTELYGDPLIANENADTQSSSVTPTFTSLQSYTLVDRHDQCPTSTASFSFLRGSSEQSAFTICAASAPTGIYSLSSSVGSSSVTQNAQDASTGVWTPGMLIAHAEQSKHYYAALQGQSVGLEPGTSDSASFASLRHLLSNDATEPTYMVGLPHTSGAQPVPGDLKNIDVSQLQRDGKKKRLDVMSLEDVKMVLSDLPRHTSDGNFSCPTCGGKFRTTNGEPKRHLKQHLGALYHPFTCIYCRDSSMLKDTIKRHVEGKHKIHFSNEVETQCTDKEKLEIILRL